MATEFTVKLPDRPGQLARLAMAFGDAKVQLRGIAAQKGTVGLLVADKDAAKARRALKKAGIRAREGKTLEMRLQDKPGSLARTASRFGKGKVNITSMYVLAPGRGNVGVAFGVKNASKAKRALG
ncbi:MAG TPA: hypothetical protein VEU77_05550 [Candidatus Acidoferrales bacterium]|jgi:hypothetical protein|nr:hypothetical protein [Candidatus Acidoferrales bacterium]